MLNETQLQEIGSKLGSERERLMKEISALSMPQNENMGGDIAGSEEEADEAEGFANNLAKAQALKDRVQEIDDALARMREGKYGTCSKCGMDMSEEMLALVPESALCSACKLAGQPS